MFFQSNHRPVLTLILLLEIIVIMKLRIQRESYHVQRPVQLQSLTLHKYNITLWFTLWQDTAGQERFHALGPIYYRDADGLYLFTC